MDNNTNRIPVLVFVSILFFNGIEAQDRVAIFPFQGIESFQSEIFAELLSSELVKTGEFEVINRTHLLELLKEQDLQLSGVLADVKEAGQLLGVEYIIVGDMAKDETQKRSFLSIRLVSVQTGEIIRVATYSMNSILSPKKARQAARYLSTEIVGSHQETIIDSRWELAGTLVGLSIIVLGIILPLYILGVVG